MTSIHDGRPGDILVIAGRALYDKRRTAEILEAVGVGDHVHYRVRWDDGHESYYYPSSDSAIRQAVDAHGRT